MIKNIKWFGIGFLTATVLASTFFFVVRSAIYAPDMANENTLRKEIEKLKEISHKQIQEITKAQMEVEANAAKMRRMEYTRRQTMSSDDVTTELAALLEESRREYSGKDE